MPSLKLRDRDAIVTKEGLIFRVFGYSHPSESCVCDVEYAPATIFKSGNPRAFRNCGRDEFFKFYEDEGLKLMQKKFPQYLLFHKMLQQKTVGVNHDDIVRLRKPDQRLPALTRTEFKDSLVVAMQGVLDIVTENTGLSSEDFGIFGSLLHGFHHPEYSDIDLTVYGTRNAARLCESLGELYKADSSGLKSEYQSEQAVKDKNWRFQNFSLRDYLLHQRRKAIYATYDSHKNRRIIKTEFEPVKNWGEITNEYDPNTRIHSKNWVRVQAKITGDDESFFFPSIYDIEPLTILQGPPETVDAKRVVSYLEEFRMQAKKDETVEIRGNLEEVATPNESFHQIVLTHCRRYYEQALKVVKLTL